MHFVTVERALRHHPTSWDEVREYTDTPDGSDLKALVDVVDTHGAKHIIKAAAYRRNAPTCRNEAAARSRSTRWSS